MTVKDAVAVRLRDICARRGIRANELANISGVHGIQSAGHTPPGCLRYYGEKAV